MSTYVCLIYGLRCTQAARVVHFVPRMPKHFLLQRLISCINMTRFKLIKYRRGYMNQNTYLDAARSCKKYVTISYVTGLKNNFMKQTSALIQISACYVLLFLFRNIGPIYSRHACCCCCRRINSRNPVRRHGTGSSRSGVEECPGRSNTNGPKV